MKLLPLLLCLLSLAGYSKEISTFFGLAYDEHQNLLFKEEYHIEREEDKILNVSTTFLSPSGEKIAHMSSAFSGAHYLPKVFFKKADTSQYGTSFVEKSIEVFKRSSSQLLKKKTLPIKDNMVAGHGFYFYILSKIESLLKGEKNQMVFIQPNRLGAYTFNMKATKEGLPEHHVKVELSIDHVLLKKFVPNIELVLNHKTKALLSYKGLSGFLSDDQSLKTISVTYTEPTSRFSASSK